MAKESQLRSKSAILQFLKTNRGWFLEQCHGCTIYSWWWVRNRKHPHKVIRCNSNAARAAYGENYRNERGEE